MYGGIIALDYTIRNTNKVKKLILVETMIYFPVWLNFLLIKGLRSWILRFMQCKKYGLNLVRMHKALRNSRPKLLFELIKEISIAEALKYIKLMKSYSRINYLQRAKGVKTPTDIVISKNTFRQVQKTARDL